MKYFSKWRPYSSIFYVTEIIEIIPFRCFLQIRHLNRLVYDESGNNNELLWREGLCWGRQNLARIIYKFATKIAVLQASNTFFRGFFKAFYFHGLHGYGSILDSKRIYWINFNLIVLLLSSLQRFTRHSRSKMGSFFAPPSCILYRHICYRL